MLKSTPNVRFTMKRVVFTFFVFRAFLSPFGLFAQTTDFKQLIETWRTAYDVPGMSVGIIRNGEVLLSDGFGVLEEGKTNRADKNTLYAIASNTKAFIAASIASLVDEGALKWDDPVRKYLPYFELYDPCVSEMMTIRDLLCHRSGLGTFSGDVIWYRNEMSAEEVVRHAKEIPQDFPFRSGFGYSNVMYITAGEVIRAVTGMSWSDYVKAHFINPLHMTRTVTSTKDLRGKPDVATPHLPQEQGNLPLDWVEWNNSGAAGGIISSAEDMLKWIDLQLHHGITENDTLFSPGSQRAMWTPQNSFPVSDQANELYGGRNFNSYGMGWSVSEYNGHMMASHTGGYDGMYSAVMLFPRDNIGIVILTNTMRSIGTYLGFEIIDKMLGLPQHDWKERGLRQDANHISDRASRIRQRTETHITGTTPSMSAEEISGVYRSPMYGDIRIEQNGGQLYINFVSAPGLKAKLTHWQYDTYQLDWVEKQAWFSFGTVQIRKDNMNKPESLLFDVPNDDIFFEEIHAERVKS